MKLVLSGQYSDAFNNKLYDWMHDYNYNSVTMNEKFNHNNGRRKAKEKKAKEKDATQKEGNVMISIDK